MYIYISQHVDLSISLKISTCVGYLLLRQSYSRIEFLFLKSIDRP